MRGFLDLQQTRVPHISRSLRDVGNEAALKFSFSFHRGSVGSLGAPLRAKLGMPRLTKIALEKSK
jgi:hypothetical protein